MASADKHTASAGCHNWADVACSGLVVTILQRHAYDCTAHNLFKHSAASLTAETTLTVHGIPRSEVHEKYSHPTVHHAAPLTFLRERLPRRLRSAFPDAPAKVAERKYRIFKGGPFKRGLLLIAVTLRSPNHGGSDSHTLGERLIISMFGIEGEPERMPQKLDYVAFFVGI